MLNFLFMFVITLLIIASPFLLVLLWKSIPTILKRVVRLLFFWPLYITSEPGRPRSIF